MRIARVSVILASFVFTAIYLAGQAKPPTPPPTTGNGGSPTSPSTGNLPSATNQPTNSTMNTDNMRGAFFFGKVVMPDGSVPPPSVVIERVCNGVARPQAYTDTNGYFSFQVGQTQDMLPDATVDRASSGPGSFGSQIPQGSQGAQNSQRSSMQAYACDLRASLAGYRSDLISLAGRRNLDDPDVGTITLHNLTKVEGLTTSATSELAPKDARKAFDKGLEAAKKSRTDEAQDDFMKAVQLYPRYAFAWFELGKIYEQRGDIFSARGAYAKSIEADSKFVNPYERLYVLSIHEMKWSEAAATTDRVIRLNSYDFPWAYYYNAVANLELGKLDAAEKSAREFLASGGFQNPKIYYVLGSILAKKQDAKGAAECLRIYLKSDQVTDRVKVTQLLANVEKQMDANAEVKPEP
jgi:tetratricopeptide (TPR) repeat protein